MKLKTITRYFRLTILGAILLIISPVVALGNIDAETEPTSPDNDLEEQHDFHDSFSERFAHKDYIILQEKYRLPKKSRNRLKSVIRAYLEIKDALAQSDSETADEWASKMEARVGIVDVNRLKGEGMKALNQHSRLLKENLQHFQHMEDLYKKRTYFSHISETVYCIVKSFTLDFEELYALYCPSAFAGKGAYWLSIDKVDRSPYLDTNEKSCQRVTSNFMGEKKKSYISPFGRSKKR